MNGEFVDLLSRRKLENFSDELSVLQVNVAELKCTFLLVNGWIAWRCTAGYSNKRRGL